MLFYFFLKHKLYWARHTTKLNPTWLDFFILAIFLGSFFNLSFKVYYLDQGFYSILFFNIELIVNYICNFYHIINKNIDQMEFITQIMGLVDWLNINQRFGMRYFGTFFNIFWFFFTKYSTWLNIPLFSVRFLLNFIIQYWIDSKLILVFSII